MQRTLDLTPRWRRPSVAKARELAADLACALNAGRELLEELRAARDRVAQLEADNEILRGANAALRGARS